MSEFEIEAAEGSLASMRHVRSGLESSGAWSAGPSTLLAALRKADHETTLVEVLAWLLDPSQGHHCGDKALAAVLPVLDPALPPASDLGRPRIAVEERRYNAHDLTDDTRATRADLVIYLPARTIVIEAKLYAGEQPGQCHRLEDGWGRDPDPTFVFLTRDGRAPTTANQEDLWNLVRWSDLSRALSTAAKANDHLPFTNVVHDFVRTIEDYHTVSTQTKAAGGPPERRAEDTKAWFYLDNFSDLEEWRSLRGAAVRLLDEQLDLEVSGLADWAEGQGARLTRAQDGPKDRRLWSLSKPRWDEHDAAPTIAIGWLSPERASRPTSTSGDQIVPYVGVRSHRALDDKNLRNDLADQLFRPVEERLPAAKGGDWPVFIDLVLPTSGAGINIPELRLLIRRACIDLWEVAAPLIDDWVAASAPSAAPHFEADPGNLETDRT